MQHRNLGYPYVVQSVLRSSRLYVYSICKSMTLCKCYIYMIMRSVYTNLIPKSLNRRLQIALHTVFLVVSTLLLWGIVNMDIQTDSSGCEHSCLTHLLLKPVCGWRVALKGQELKQRVYTVANRCAKAKWKTHKEGFWIVYYGKQL